MTGCLSLGRATTIVVLLGTTIVACNGSDGSTPAPSASTGSTTASSAERSPGSSPVAPTSSVTASSATETSAPTDRVPTFVVAACADEVAATDRVTCGYVDVPERHGDPGGPTVRVAVALVAPVTPPPTSVPVVVLAGGPGYGSVGETDGVLAGRFGARTVVLVDYRGVGASEPTLACPEVDALAVSSLGLDADAPSQRAALLDAAEDCHDRLVAGGVDLSAYNYTEIATDLDDVRRALGYEHWDLYGVSNGGRVALEVVRRHPAGVRSVVLDAALPPQGSLQGELWPHAQRAFSVLFDGCRADVACALAFPDLEATFSRLVAGLGATPVDIDVVVPDAAAPVVVRFTDTTVLNALRGALYETPLIPLLPLYLSELAAGRRFDDIAQLIVDRATPRRFSQGMSWSVDCQEEVAFLPDGFFEDQAEQFPELAPVILADMSEDVCDIWDVGRADPSIEQPVVSDVPALLLVGEYDPVHPVASSELIADGLSRATLIELPGLGHGTVDAHPCPAALVVAFLDDPNAPVDSGCVGGMGPPSWVLP